MNGAPYWVPIVTLIIGAVLAYAADHFRGSRSEQRRRELARRDFERATLIEPQDRLGRLARATGRLHYSDLMAYQRTGKWASGEAHNEAAEEEARASREIHRFRSRLRDQPTQGRE